MAKDLQQKALIAITSYNGVIYPDGTRTGLFFTDHEVTDYTSAKTADTKAYARFFWNMIERGVYFAPSQFEAGFLSNVHTEELLDQTVRAARESFASLTVAV